MAVPLCRTDSKRGGEGEEEGKRVEFGVCPGGGGGFEPGEVASTGGEGGGDQKFFRNYNHSLVVKTFKYGSYKVDMIVLHTKPNQMILGRRTCVKSWIL